MQTLGKVLFQIRFKVLVWLSTLKHNCKKLYCSKASSLVCFNHTICLISGVQGYIHQTDVRNLTQQSTGPLKYLDQCTIYTTLLPKEWWLFNNVLCTSDAFAFNTERSPKLFAKLHHIFLGDVQMGSYLTKAQFQKSPEYWIASLSKNIFKAVWLLHSIN